MIWMFFFSVRCMWKWTATIWNGYIRWTFQMKNRWSHTKSHTILYSKKSIFGEIFPTGILFERKITLKCNWLFSVFLFSNFDENGVGIDFRTAYGFDSTIQSLWHYSSSKIRDTKIRKFKHQRSHTRMIHILKDIYK